MEMRGEGQKGWGVSLMCVYLSAAISTVSLSIGVLQKPYTTSSSSVAVSYC